MLDVLGDALGSLVESQSPEEIRRSHPAGVWERVDSGTWNSIAGQPTDMPVKPALLDTIDKAAKEPPAGYVQQQGWALIAFRNALWQLLHAPSLEESADDTIMRGGATPMRPFRKI